MVLNLITLTGLFACRITFFLTVHLTNFYALMFPMEEEKRVKMAQEDCDISEISFFLSLVMSHSEQVCITASCSYFGVGTLVQLSME